MTNYRFLDRVLGIVVLVLVGIVASANVYAGQGGKEDFVFFGDSLSDTGNRFFYEGTLNTPPYSTVGSQNLVPSSPYAMGGPTFSNGKVFPEYIASALGRGGLSKPAARSSGIAANYAYGGARAANFQAPNSNRNLDQQVADYIADGVKPGAIHVIAIGGNDLGIALQAAAVGFPPVDPYVVIGDAIEAMFVQLGTLQSAGAERFLIVTSANPGLIPAFEGNPLAIGVGAFFTSALNCAVVGEGPNRPPCQGLGVPLPAFTVKQVLEFGGAEVSVFEGQAFFDGLYFDPAAFGISNVTDACIMPDEPPFQCSDPDAYLFWDGVHPAKRAHEIIGGAIAEFLAQ